jgi:hypothetical protein
MILAAHSDAAYLNVSKARSRAGAHIMLLEDIPIPAFNGPILTLSQIIKFVASSAAKQNLWVSMSVPKKWSHYKIPLRKWAGRNPSLQFKPTTPQHLVLPTKPSSPKR